MNQTQDNRLISIEEAADTLGVSAQQARKWARTGYLTQAKKIGKFWRIRQRDLDAFIENPPPLPEAPPEPDPAPEASAPPADYARRKAALIAQLQAMRHEGLSLQQIADRMNAAGVPTVSGRGQWTKGSVGDLLHQGEGGVAHG